MDDVGSYSPRSRLQASKPLPSIAFRTIRLGASVVKETRYAQSFPTKSSIPSIWSSSSACSPKNIDSGYEAVSLRRPASLDNNSSLTKVLFCTPFQNELLSNPLCVAAATILSHRSQSLNPLACSAVCAPSLFGVQLRLQRGNARFLRLKALKCFLHLLLSRHGG